MDCLQDLTVHLRVVNNRKGKDGTIMKKFFEQPEIAVTKLDVEDIITASETTLPEVNIPDMTALG